MLLWDSLFFANLLFFALPLDFALSKAL
jgi:hypothetical protein